MGWLIGLFAKAGLKKFAPVAAYGLVILLLVGALLWLRADAYHDGEHAEEARWQEAAAKLEHLQQKAATGADQKAAQRLDQHLDQLEHEKEKLDEAQRNGDDPLDVLFPSS